MRCCTDHHADILTIVRALWSIRSINEIQSRQRISWAATHMLQLTGKDPLGRWRDANRSWTSLWGYACKACAVGRSRGSGKRVSVYLSAGWWYSAVLLMQEGNSSVFCCWVLCHSLWVKSFHPCGFGWILRVSMPCGCQPCCARFMRERFEGQTLVLLCPGTVFHRSGQYLDVPQRSWALFS